MLFFFVLVSKALDSIIHFKITPHLSNSQLGFLENHPCLKQSLSSFFVITRATKSKPSCDIAFLNFKKAFDSLSRSELFYTLWLLGITGSLCCWFNAYLTDCTQSHLVSIKGSLFDPLQVHSGIHRAAF